MKYKVGDKVIIRKPNQIHENGLYGKVASAKSYNVPSYISDYVVETEYHGAFMVNENEMERYEDYLFTIKDEDSQYWVRAGDMEKALECLHKDANIHPSRVLVAREGREMSVRLG